MRLLAACATVGLGLALSPAASATVTPITTQADGNSAGTLRYAISHAAGTDTVDVPAGTYKLTLGTAIIAPAGLTIAGAGATSTVIDGGGSSMILYAAGSLTVSGITFTHGMATVTGGNGGGGAIRIDGAGTLTVSGSAFKSNAASLANSDFSGGGAIYVNGGASANVSGTTFSGNTVTASGLDNDGGGAIFVGGGSALTLSSDAFSGDEFTMTNAATTGLDGGGGVYGSGAATITGSTFRGESSSVSAITPNSVYDAGGGAVWSGGGTTVTTSAFAGNRATVSQGAMSTGGGGIYSTGGPLSITSSTLSANHVALSLVGFISNGGGAAYNAGTTTTIVNTTLSGNTVTATGGANTAGGGAYYDKGSGGGTISSSTIDGNSVSFPTASGAAYGGGIYEYGVGGTLALHNTIVSGNSVSGGLPAGANCYTLGGTTITSAGHNIEDANTCNLTGPGDQPNTNPLLGPLQDNGGPAFTQGLLPGSPAINRGDNTGCPATDERGVARPQGGTCDIGAYEVGVADLSLSATVAPNPIATGGRLSYTARVANAGPTPTNAMLRVTIPTGATLTSATAGQGSCSPTGTTVSCALGALSPGASASATIVVSPHTPGKVTTTLTASSSDPDPTPADNSRTLTVTATAPPVLTAVKESAKKWHEGKGLAHISAKSKRTIGTTFSFKLNESARVTLAFAVGSHNRGKLTFSAKAGKRKVRFQGRLSRSKRLKPGRYKVTITAINATGQRSRAHTLRFTILNR